MLLAMRAFPLFLALAFAGLPAAAAAQDADEEEVYNDLLHADLPLYTFDWADAWPRQFDPVEEPGVISLGGCESRVRFGDWRYTPAWAEKDKDSNWLRLENYGVFHCAANIYRADTRDELARGEFSRGLFVLIGKGSAGGRDYEMWALQDGFVPGSTYTLLAREVAEGDGAVTRFDVLQTHCPKDRVRRVRGLDVWRSEYCAIESRTALLSLARRMLRRPFLGEFVLVGDALPDPEGAED
jgi:hypothetical protein